MINKINNVNYLIYSPDYPPVVGGAEIFVGQYADFLRSKVHSITIITRYPTKASRRLNKICKQPIYFKEDNLEIYRAPYVEIKYLRVLSSIFITYLFFFIVLIKKKYNYIHFIGFYPSAIIWILSKFLINNSKIIYTEQGMLVDVIRDNKNIYDVSPKFLQKYFNKFFITCDKITCVSDVIKKRFFEINANLKVKIIPNGTNVRNVSLIQKSEIRIISTSRLVQKNNIQTLVMAMPLVLKKYTGVKKITLDLVGDGEESHLIKNLIKIHNLDNTVIMHGSLSKEEVQSLYKCSSLFCRLSVSEGFGISFIEALSWGLPIIGSNIIADMPYFSSNYGRSIKNIYDVEEVSEAILCYLNNNYLLESSSVLAVKASKKFDWETINQSYIDYIISCEK